MDLNLNLCKTIQEAIDRRNIKSKEDIFSALIEAGANEQHKAEIVHVLDNGMITLEIGATPENIFYDYLKFLQERRKEQAERIKLLLINKSMEQIEELITKYRQNASIISSENLEGPITELVLAASKMQDIIKPQQPDMTNLLKSTNWEDIIHDLKKKPEAIKTGYSFKNSPLYFQTGALSVVAGPTGHGKTTLLINLLLDAAERYPNQRHWLFSYEEEASAIVVKTLNAYCNQSYSNNNRKTIESSLRSDTDKYFKNGTETYSHFQEKIEHFKQLLSKGVINIRAVDYSNEDLIKAIRTVSGDNAGLILIDYLQLLYLSNTNRFQTRPEELKRICLDLKNVAIETRRAIIAGAQFNREVQSPDGMKLQCISDASDIEKTANKVIALWNGDRKSNNSSEKFRKVRHIDPGVIYMEVLKARDEQADMYDVFPWNGNHGVIGKSTGRITKKNENTENSNNKGWIGSNGNK